MLTLFQIIPLKTPLYNNTKNSHFNKCNIKNVVTVKKKIFAHISLQYYSYYCPGLIVFLFFKLLKLNWTKSEFVTFKIISSSQKSYVWSKLLLILKVLWVSLSLLWSIVTVWPNVAIENKIILEHATLKKQFMKKTMIIICRQRTVNVVTVLSILCFMA